MRSSSQWRRTLQAAAWRAAKSAATYTAVGGILALATVVLSAFNLISAQQSIALALPALVITIRGLLGLIIGDTWTAWRRGFRQGCLAATRYYVSDSESDLSTVQIKLHSTGRTRAGGNARPY